MKYAIIDIETTGLSPKNEKVTEIAIFIHNGKKIVDEFSTLINPEKKIPFRIVQITGINNQMVESAPKFYEVAKKIVEFTQDAIFVGHNVRFDYGFIRNEFLSLGYDYQRKTMDTVQWSRKLIPGKPSYSLGKLCASLGIENEARHRATGDALATVRLFELLLSLAPELSNSQTGKLKSQHNKSLVDDLPTETGVYYFYNKTGELIYVGKSVNIHDRVLSHLNNNLNKKEIEMKNQLAEVRYQVTGSELVALLLESAEIKKHQPLYNHAQRRTYYNFGLYSFKDDEGYLNLKLSRILEERNPLYTYSSVQEGKEHLYQLTERYELCQKLTGLYDSAGACFQYQIRQCKGACMGEEPSETYNNRVREALENYHFSDQNFLLFDSGRKEKEYAIVKVENGKYIGFGYVDESLADGDLELIHEHITAQKDNKEVRRIIIAYLKKQKGIKQILTPQASDTGN